MLNSQVRQEKIKSTLLTSEQPVSANHFAKLFGVSRQTIVGDIALLRAKGQIIHATPNGYEYAVDNGKQFTVVCQHTKAQTEEELMIIIRDGGAVLSVTVDHPLYGELSGRLTIRTEVDVHQFIYHLQSFKGHLLSELTDGIHSHTIAVEDAAQMEQIKHDLENASILYR